MDTKRHDVPTDSNRATWTRVQLLERTAQFIGGPAMERCEGPVGHMKTVVTHTLTDLDYTVMQNAGLRVTSDNRMTTFALGTDGYWNFRHDRENNDAMSISLNAIAYISEVERGIVFKPRAHGTFLSPADDESHHLMFRIIASLHPGAPDIVQMLAQGRIVVMWGEIGLGGICSIETLFKEFCRGNDTIRLLALTSSLNPFSPNPNERSGEAEDIFIVESAQPKLFADWRKQLDKLRSRLTV